MCEQDLREILAGQIPASHLNLPGRTCGETSSGVGLCPCSNSCVLRFHTLPSKDGVSGFTGMSAAFVATRAGIHLFVDYGLASSRSELPKSKLETNSRKLGIEIGKGNSSTGDAYHTLLPVLGCRRCARSSRSLDDAAFIPEQDPRRPERRRRRTRYPQTPPPSEKFVKKVARSHSHYSPSPTRTVDLSYLLPTPAEASPVKDEPMNSRAITPTE
ncbi:hypothetical protein K438DRAFT_1970961 [Mycena galopus ATCC 62051]|nr:hypothetical protein K438DRAFT_1970961 [Mycena galopus ATCC 62051]